MNYEKRIIKKRGMRVSNMRLSEKVSLRRHLDRLIAKGITACHVGPRF